jgi:peptidoglycan-N-acetylglucosamine deacetylase
MLKRYPHLSGKPERYLCAQLDGKSIGNRLLCLDGKTERGRIKLGVSKLKNGKPRKQGKVSARIERGKKQLQLTLSIDAIGVKPGKLAFAARSGWFGPECKPGPNYDGPNPAVCVNRIPARGNGHTEIRALQRVGCDVPLGTYNRGSRSKKRVALTFDDGPTSYTSQVLDILDRRNAKGTFFHLGSQVSAYASLERKILAHGHELANHSWNHARGPGTSDLRSVNEVIEKATGFKPCTFRPPYGYLPSSTASAAKSLGMASVIWDVDTNDWQLPGSGSIQSRGSSGGKGSIVLMHDGGGNRSQTVAALPGIVDSYKKRGYELVTVTEILGGKFKVREVKRRKTWNPLIAKPEFPLLLRGE